MPPFARRTFLGASAAAGASTVLASPAPPAGAASHDPPPPPKVTLGDTGVQLTRLGQGTGVHGGKRQSDQTRLGFDDLVGLFHHAYERGLRFFDLADLYGTHIYFREALRTIPRDEVAILTKMWWRFDGPEQNTSQPHRRQVAKSALERFRHELSTDYLDIVLLHCLMDAGWRDQMGPYLDVLNDEKARGRVKAVGVSCHDFGALQAAAESDWVEVILARTNPKGVKMDAPPDEVNAVLRRAKASGKSIIGMKIFGEGELSGEADACVQYAQSLDYLDAMTIGFHKPEQIDDVLRLMAKHPAA